jgi:hypothetical protein
MAVVILAKWPLTQTPQFNGGATTHRLSRFRLQPHHRPVRIHPQLQSRLPGPDFDHAFAQLQFLPEPIGNRQRRIERHPDPADLAEPAVLVPRVSLADVEDKLARRLNPGIDAHIAITQRHGSVAVLAGRIPDRVVLVHGVPACCFNSIRLACHERQGNQGYHDRTSNIAHHFALPSSNIPSVTPETFQHLQWVHRISHVEKVVMPAKLPMGDDPYFNSLIRTLRYQTGRPSS